MHHPDFGLPINYSMEVVGDDPEEQVARTVGLMRRYVLEDLSDPLVASAAASLRGETQAATAHNVWGFVNGLMQFQEDSDTAARGPGLSSLEHPVVEVLIRPRDVLDLYVNGGNSHPVGDCDDFTMLATALLRANGIRTSFVTAAHEPGEDRFSHIYSVAYVDGGTRLALDTSHGGELGQEHPSHRIKEWPLSPGPGCLALIVLAVVVFYFMTEEEEGGELY